MSNAMRVAFVVERFPAVSETFLIDQVADLLDRGVHVEIFTFKTGSEAKVSQRYQAYRMASLTHRLHPPSSNIQRVYGGMVRALLLLCIRPIAMMRTLNFLRYGRAAWSLQLIYWSSAFVCREFDLVHCHFGTSGVRFLMIKEVLGLRVPMVTTFYGHDVSLVFKQHPPDFYRELKARCPLYFVMSNDMKRRVVAQGFSEETVSVHPVSIDVDGYPFKERQDRPESAVELVFVGRLVEKKGVDDLLRALAIVRQKSSRGFRCTIIGAGDMEGELVKLSGVLGLQGVVEFAGAMRIEEIIKLLLEKQILIAPSKTASSGDME